MKRQKDQKNWSLRLAGILLCLVLVSTHMTADLFARYTAIGGGEDEARVAMYVFDVQDKSTAFTIPVENNVPGDKSTYGFMVTNQNANGKICETAQEYTITIQLDGSLPLVCSLSGSNIQLDALTGTSFPMEASCSGTMQAAVAEEDEYTLTIDWPKDSARLDPKYRDGAAEVEIQISATQID